MIQSKTVCIIGLGYIGLPTACLLARAGHQVIGVDINQTKLELLSAGYVPFQEPGLQEILSATHGQMRFSAKPEPADVFIVCVPTPLTEGHRPDMTFVRQAIDDIIPVLQANNLIILESTISPGYTRNVALPLIRDKNVMLTHVPERAMPGYTLEEIQNNDRVIGGITDEAARHAEALYRSFVKGTIHLTDSTTAESIKLVENAYRDTNIAYANELAKICDEIGVNVWEVIELANRHPRVNILNPGPGVGGHCLAVDPWFLIDRPTTNSQIIGLARTINDSMPQYVADQVLEMTRAINQPKIVILGVAYKADVDDTRESPAIRLGERLISHGCQVVFHDPLAKKFAYPVHADLLELTEEADCLVLVTNHQMYGELDPLTINNMRNKLVFDSRNQLSAEKWRDAGFVVKILGTAS